MRSQPLSSTPSHSHSLPPISQEKHPTLTYFLTKTTRSHSFFKKNNQLQRMCQEKRPTPTYFSRKTTRPSYSYFFDNNDPLSPIFQEKNPFPLKGALIQTNSNDEHEDIDMMQFSLEVFIWQSLLRKLLFITLCQKVQKE